MLPSYVWMVWLFIDILLINYFVWSVRLQIFIENGEVIEKELKHVAEYILKNEKKNPLKIERKDTWNEFKHT